MKRSQNGTIGLKPNMLLCELKKQNLQHPATLNIEQMTIKPLDVLFMLDEEDIEMMEHTDLQRLCVLVSLDLQLERESYAQSPNNRRNMC